MPPPSHRRRRPLADGAAPRPPRAAPWAERRFAAVLGGVCLLSLLCRVAILCQYIGTNPMAGAPVNDARVYWQWAWRVAMGKLVQDTPFFSAPLYPYLLGVLRAFGGSLDLVYVLQTLAVMAVACLLAVVCRKRFGAGVGLLAAVMFLLLQEPASASLRILPGCLQMTLVVIVWVALVGVQAEPSFGRHAAVGVALGLLCLAYGPALLLVPLVAVWLVWPGRSWPASARATGGQARSNGPTGPPGGLKPAARRVLRLVVMLGPVVVLIVPATLHNWRIDRELFLVRAGAGVVLRQGSHPDSDGLLTPIPGISGYRDDMFDHAARLVGEATGQTPTWKGVDRYFRDQTLDYWRSEPLRLVELVATKLYWFLSSRNYGDMYEPRAEIALGLTDRLRLTPLPTPWLIGPALVGVVLMLRRPSGHAPELLLIAVPLLAVAVFFYSPRFRLPAVPILAVAAAWAVERAWRGRVHWPTAVAVLVALGVGVVLSPINRAVGFDVESPARTCFNAAYGFERAGDTEAAIEWWRRGLGFRPDDVAHRMILGDQFSNMGRLEEALFEYEQARSVSPGNVGLLARIGETLYRQQEYARACRVLGEALERDPADLAVLSLLAGATAARGDTDEARALWDRAVELAPQDAGIRVDRGQFLMGCQQWEDARAELTRAARLSPGDYDARYLLGVVHAQLDELPEARRFLERALEIRPLSVEAWHDLGVLNAMQGRLGEAEECFQRALAVDPGEERCRQALEQLRSGATGVTEPDTGP